ncbi:OTU protein [Sporothrix epigloea]|uniref:OTU protein n=1 Tax=Sporothrix epigloea TaxID=1892477 RepID=A0ABP0DB72_9PEZI
MATLAGIKPDTANLMESIEEIRSRHRRELRDLQGRITNKKKNATKKTRKGVNDECAALEQSIRERHQAELLAVTGGNVDNDEDKSDNEDQKDSKESPRNILNGGAQEEEDKEVDADADADAVADKLAAASIGSSVNELPQQQQQPKKRNRQKDRLARRAAEMEEQASKAQEEASHMLDHKAIEQEKMKSLLAASGRDEYAIRPDGHCLFSAVADQLATVAGRSVQLVPDDAGLEPFRVVRHVAARYMKEHPDDFAPFLLASEDGVDLAAYVEKIRNTVLWGGQMELMALANAYDVCIQVLHDGRSELIRPAGDTGDTGTTVTVTDKDKETRPTLWLVYYRHGYGLGEHYNSLRPKATF